MARVTGNSGRAPSLRAQHADRTRKAVVKAARREFARRGFSGTSLDTIAARARVTKGALYHHFPGGKQALFLAVFEALEAELVAAIGEAAGTVSSEDPWQVIDAALWAFVRHSARPEYLQIVLVDGPRELAMGQQREIDQGGALQMIEVMLAALTEHGELPALPAPALSRIWLGALTEGAQVIAHSGDREAAIEDVHRVLWALLRGLRHDPAPAAVRGGCSRSSQ